jgi:xylose isomerase
MRTYRALAERARAFDELPEVKEALAAASAPDLAIPSVDGDGVGGADQLKAESDALDELAQRGYYNERLDQLVVEVLLGLH